MRKSTDTILRQWSLLQLIPKHPIMISTTELHNKLVNEGYSIDKRTTERDLDRLSTAFPITCDVEGRMNKWYWSPHAKTIEIPGMTPSSALAFRLLEEYLKPLLPGSVLELLSPYMIRAKEVIKQTKLNRWSKRVMTISKGPTLLPPIIKKDVQSVINEALLENRRFKVTYTSRGKGETNEYEVNPLGLVLRDGIMYLVATLWDYKDVRQLALHRMSKAKLSNILATKIKEFSLREYIESEQEFSYPRTRKLMKIRVSFSPGTAYHLFESKLSENQKLSSLRDGRILLEAAVSDTEDIRWWLRGFGSQVEILSPPSLRQEFSEETKLLMNYYG